MQQLSGLNFIQSKECIKLRERNHKGKEIADLREIPNLKSF